MGKELLYRLSNCKFFKKKWPINQDFIGRKFQGLNFPAPSLERWGLRWTRPLTNCTIN